MNIGIEAPTKEDLDRKVGRRSDRDDDDLLGDAEQDIEDAIREQGPLEWLEDDPLEERDMKDPFHILLLKRTFDKPKITVPYVATNLEYVLSWVYFLTEFRFTLLHGGQYQVTRTC